MRYVYPFTVLAAIVAPAMLFAEGGFVAPTEQTIGRNLQAFISVRLTDQAPATGLDVTITSDDPTKVLLGATPTSAGSKSITLKIRAQYIETPDFYIQGHADSGSATYTITAPGFASNKGIVKLAPSAILIVGPFKAPSFKTTTGTSSKMTFYAAHLDAAGNFGAQQGIAGGMTVPLEVGSSNAKAGAIVAAQLEMKGGESSLHAEFKPAGVGTTILTVKAPAGFSSAAKQYAAVSAAVDEPGIGLTGDINLGKDLQVPSFILLAEPAPAKGLDVTLTSSDPKALVLSASDDKLGTGTLKIHVAAGEMRVPYFIQGLAESGSVTHTASAPGYRSRVAPVYMAPSGFMVVYSPYGPPDEAEYLRSKSTRDPRAFTVTMGERKPTHLTIWPVYLDPKTRRGADMTAQRLRPGIKVVANLANTNPAVAKVPAQVVLNGPAEWAMVEFVPMTEGQTVISVDTPAGFTTPSNAITVAATVKP